MYFLSVLGLSHGSSARNLCIVSNVAPPQTSGPEAYLIHLLSNGNHILGPHSCSQIGLVAIPEGHILDLKGVSWPLFLYSIHFQSPFYSDG